MMSGSSKVDADCQTTLSEPPTLTSEGPSLTYGQFPSTSTPTNSLATSPFSPPLLLSSVDTTIEPGHNRPPPPHTPLTASPPTPSPTSINTPSSPTSPPPLTPEPPQHTTSPNSTTYRPTYHIARPARKIQDWSFKGRRPILILGDSNINRIPGHNNPSIQLDSFPGANAYHFSQICNKTRPDPNIKIVIFSIGINNKDQDPRKTTLKQLKTLVRTAKSTFPNANIYFPLLNYSTQLTQEQQDNLKLINDTMFRHCPTLPAIPQDNFITERDNIHWTPATAKTIFGNWCRELNL